MQEAYDYFVKNGISFDQLAQEIKEDFSAIHCISANEDKEIEKNQLILNSLEDIDNPYRAVFAVDKLNEGWDVLNLFDIVRLYETRDGKTVNPARGQFRKRNSSDVAQDIARSELTTNNRSIKESMMPMLTTNFAFARRCIIIVGTNRDISANYIPPCAKSDLISKV